MAWPGRRGIGEQRASGNFPNRADASGRAKREVSTVRPGQTMGRGADVANELADTLPDEPFVWISLAYATRRKTGGSISEAKTILLGAELKFPKHYLLPYNLACYCSQLGELAQAEQWLKKAV